MTVWDFANQSPILAFFIAWIAAWAFVAPFRLYFRSRNIQTRGWPPDYLDADGDTHRPDCDCKAKEAAE